MDDKLKTIAWQMSVDNAIIFFELCSRLGVTTEKQRTDILIDMVKRGKMQRVWATKKSREEFIKHISREHKVLYVKPKET